MNNGCRNKTAHSWERVLQKNPSVWPLLLTLALVPPAVSTEATKSASASARYNLILISLGNVGAAHMSLYGYARKTTPRLDQWAKDAVVFDEAFSPASWTLPVGVSLFTSLYPYAHKVTSRGVRNDLNASIETLPEILAKAGYQTAAFTGGLDYYKGFAQMRGFAEAPDNPDFSGYHTTLPQAEHWLAGRDQRPFFLFVHGYDAHCPFVPPKEFQGAFSSGTVTAAVAVSPGHCIRGVTDSPEGYYVEEWPRCDLDRKTLQCRSAPFTPRRGLMLTRGQIDGQRDLYDESVLGVDDEVGRFLSSLSSATLAQTVVVVYCEHGEMLGKHGRFGRVGTFRGTLYDDVLHVPLLIRIPGVPGRRVRSFVELTDVMPTLLDVLGVKAEPPPSMQGEDLRSLLTGPDSSVHRYVYAGMTFDLGKPRLPAGRKECSSIRDANWRLILESGFVGYGPRKRVASHAASKVRLFHDSQDPDELRDVAASHPDVAARMLKNLERWREACRRFVPFDPGTKAIRADLLRHARERGYW